MIDLVELIAEARFYESPGHVSAYAESVFELLDSLADALEAATRERDAALAAIERVRERHEPRERVRGGFRCRSCCDPVSGGFRDWPCPTVAALDGALEPEEKP